MTQTEASMIKASIKAVDAAITRLKRVIALLRGLVPQPPPLNDLAWADRCKRICDVYDLPCNDSFVQMFSIRMQSLLQGEWLVSDYMLYREARRAIGLQAIFNVVESIKKGQADAKAKVAEAEANKAAAAGTKA